MSAPPAGASYRKEILSQFGQRRPEVGLKIKILTAGVARTNVKSCSNQRVGVSGMGSGGVLMHHSSTL